jgi:hypothetical protein
MHRSTRVFVLVIAAALGAGCAGTPGYSQSVFDDGSPPYLDRQEGWVARAPVREERKPAAERAPAKAQRSNQKTTRATSAPAATTGGDDRK